jgi:hypothetical protein
MTLTADGAAKLIMLNFSQEQNEAKTVLAITGLVNEAYAKGIAVGRAEKEAAVTAGWKCPKCLVDRTKEPCPELTNLGCPMHGTAQSR